MTVVLFPIAGAELVAKDLVGMLRIRVLHLPVSLRGRYMSPWRLPTSFEPMSLVPEFLAVEVKASY